MKKTQGGFSVVEALLIVIILGMISGTGWYVWHAKTQADTSLNSANSTSQNMATLSNAKDKNDGYFVVKEWNIRAKNSYGVTPLYKFANKVIYLSSKELVNADPQNCYVASGAGGTITKAKPDAEYETPNGIPTGNTVDQEVKSGRLIKSYAKIGDYYYWYNRPQFNCLGPKGSQEDIQVDVVGAYESMVPKLESIPTQ